MGYHIRVRVHGLGSAGPDGLSPPSPPPSPTPGPTPSPTRAGGLASAVASLAGVALLILSMFPQTLTLMGLAEPARQLERSAGLHAALFFAGAALLWASATAEAKSRTPQRPWFS